MKTLVPSLKVRVASFVILGAALAGCGGSPSEQAVTPSPVSASTSGSSERSLSATSASNYIPQSRGTAAANNTSSTSAVTDVRFESTASATQNNIPVSFGQIFAPGHLASGAALAGRLDSGEVLPLQLDVKATHPDGSVRHAVISAVLPTLGAGEVRTMTLQKTTSSASTTSGTADLLNAGFTASFDATINGVHYTASADQLMRQAAAKAWLSGSTASEWQVSAPLKTSAGVAHPHLSARFSVRWYNAVKQARVDVVVENNWAYEAAPQNFTYDANIVVGGKSVYAKAALQHFHHARWRKVFWWNGAAPEVNVKHNVDYLIDSRALPNFDRSVSIPETVLNTLKSRWTGAATEPMGQGLALPYMPTTGGRPDIGLLPQWAAVYLLSMDRRARDVTLGTAELAGSFSAHYRDKNTGQPVSVIDYPYMTLLGKASDTVNPATKRAEAFPACASSTACKSTLTADVAHQPAFAYLPYVLTGDHYFLEELQFWSMYNIFTSNPGYRENIKGLLKSEQVRGQAWGLRTLAEAAYITPDSDRLKEHFNRMLDSNLDWYNANYSDNPDANPLGALLHGYAVGYSDQRAIGPWQDDFFTSAVGHAHELGFAKATALLKYKTMFPIKRMTGSGACYIRAAMYTMMVRDSETSPFYVTIDQAYKASNAFDLGETFNTLQCASTEMAGVLKLKVGEMTGYSSIHEGYPSNMQPALAYGADVGGADGTKAWAVFMSRSVKPNYALGPQFDIVPR